MIETENGLSEADKEEHRRVFWSIYILDRLGSCGRAKPLTIADLNCQLCLPTDEASYREGTWTETPTLEEIANFNPGAHDAYGSFANEVMMARTLGKTSQYMLQDINICSVAPPWDAHSGYATLQSELLHLETILNMSDPIANFVIRSLGEDGNIDHTGVGPVVFARALFHLCYTLINHPFLLRRRIRQFAPAPTSFLARAFKSGWEHAKSLVVLLKETRCAGCFIRNPFYGYCILVSATIIGLHLSCTEEGIAEEAETLLHETICILDDIGQSFKNVASMVRDHQFHEDPYSHHSTNQHAGRAVEEICRESVAFQ